MSVNEISRFQKDLKENKELQKKLIELGNDVNKIVELAKANGYDFTKNEIDELIQNKKAGELADEDLEKVAGGAVLSIVLDAVI